MKVKVHLFDALKKLVNIKHNDGEFTVALQQGATLEDLLQVCNLPREKVTVAMINGMISHDNISLHDDDEVTLFPSIGGNS